MRDVTNNLVGSGPVYTEAELLDIPEIREMWLEECRRRAVRRALLINVALAVGPVVVLAALAWGVYA
ncbi:hypothetical protein ACS15_1720 [Ralstonia insidiosa]|uniref:Uncharacterized protein n=1 Tax=Ralstonia insidiosa TaxID=190721 RepID=A0AAC9FSC4_9RALS|nr:hypothetical protein [Ralstonia insidiosa]ANH74827.1 hypothetical protein ACS15_1720 [Ralstonia insidiosa]